MAPLRALTMASPAKVNLFLEVTGRRPDGYHRLATLFAKIDLADDVRVEAFPGRGVRLELVNRSGTRVPSGRSNLAVRAAKAFLKKYRVKAGVRIRLVKRIPAGGGLGGGSSNAGTVLRAMARLFPGAGRGEGSLARLGAGLGADVPLFCRPGLYFLGKGVGDELTPLRVRAALPPLVLVQPGVSVSTARAYSRLALPRRSAVLTSLSRLDKLVDALEAGEPPLLWAKLLFNRLEEAVLPFYPAVASAKEALLSMGAPAAVMTGSGACVFAVGGRRLLRRLQRTPWDCRLVRSGRIVGDHRDPGASAR